MNRKEVINWKVFGILLIIGIFHLITALVMSLFLQVAYPGTLHYGSMGDLLTIIVVFFKAVGCAVAIFVGLYLGKSAGLGAPLLEGWVNGEGVRDRVLSVLLISVVCGLSVAVLRYFLDVILFSPFVPSLLMQWRELPFGVVWTIPFEQGIGDEITYRLFWMTIFAWIISKIQKPESNQPTSPGMWAAILIVTCVSIPGTLFWISGPIVRLQLALLTAIGGMVFGWLYWKKGIESALLSHFISSVVLVFFALYI